MKEHIEIFRYKGKKILYNTGLVEEIDTDEPAMEDSLTADQMKIVMSSMSDNRISDSVKDLVEHAGAEVEAEHEDNLTEEQMRIVMNSMSDNRISDIVKELVEKATD